MLDTKNVINAGLLLISVVFLSSAITNYYTKTLFLYLTTESSIHIAYIKSIETYSDIDGNTHEVNVSIVLSNNTIVKSFDSVFIDIFDFKVGDPIKIAIIGKNEHIIPVHNYLFFIEFLFFNLILGGGGLFILIKMSPQIKSLCFILLDSIKRR